MKIKPYGLADRIIARLSAAFFWYVLIIFILANIVYYGLCSEPIYNEEKTKNSKFRA